MIPSAPPAAVALTSTASIKGLDEKLKEAKAQAEAAKFSELEVTKGAEASSEIKNAYALMVVSNKEKLTGAVEKFFPRIRAYQMHSKTRQRQCPLPRPN